MNMTDLANLTEAVRRGTLQAHPDLSRFSPLPRILVFDDFDTGINGWVPLIGNHDGNLDSLPPLRRDLRPPQLSSCSFFDVGTHGSMSGNYALKLATRARAGSWSTALKRLTLSALSIVQVELWFTFKAEQTFGRQRDFDGNVSPSEQDFGFFTIMNDVWGGADEKRFLSAVRYVNTDHHGNMVKAWMYKTANQPSTRDHYETDPDYGDDLNSASLDDWAVIPNGEQGMCFNETATKVNWHYLRWQYDIAACRNVELQVNDRTMDLRNLPVPLAGRYESLDYLLNTHINVRTRKDVRNFLFLDSVVISADW
jgi:hypothetical protein